MPILSGLRKKIEVKLPQSKGTVWLWEYALAGEMLGGMSINAQGVSNPISPIEVVTSLVADWDFTDEANEKLPITGDNVKQLPISDFTIIANQVTKITEVGTLPSEVKKNIPSSST